MRFTTPIALVSAHLFAAVVPLRAQSMGVFADHSDVGAPKLAGKAVYDETKKSYSVTGGGANMWQAKDSFHFVWKKVSGDAALTADITFEGKGTDPHRKACLLFRQSLDIDAVYADAALHGDGLTSLQYRNTKGANTQEVKTNVTAPRRLRLEKKGRTIALSLAGADGKFAPAGEIQLDLTSPFFVGLGVCSHNDEVLETAVFSNVELKFQETAAKKSGAELADVKALPDGRPRSGKNGGWPFVAPLRGSGMRVTAHRGLVAHGYSNHAAPRLHLETLSAYLRIHPGRCFQNSGGSVTSICSAAAAAPVNVSVRP